MSGEITITEQDRGREVPVSAGDVIELRLPENPTTGMRWSFDDHAGVEILEDSNDLAKEPEPGAASERVFRLRVLGGDAHIQLHRGQAWEPGTPPDASFELNLRAQ